MEDRFQNMHMERRTSENFNFFHAKDGRGGFCSIRPYCGQESADPKNKHYSKQYRGGEGRSAEESERYQQLDLFTDYAAEEEQERQEALDSDREGRITGSYRLTIKEKVW